MLKWRIAAISSQIALVLYWEITEYVDLFPWNDVAMLNIRTQIRDSLVNDLPKLVFIYAFIKGVRWLMATSIGFYALWLAAILNQRQYSHFAWPGALVGGARGSLARSLACARCRRMGRRRGSPWRVRSSRP